MFRIISYCTVISVNRTFCSISRLPFRLLVRRHGVDLAYSPMIMSAAFLHSEKSRSSDFTTCPSDRPMIAQIACQSGPEFARCAEELAKVCDGIDLNCGCPQRLLMFTHAIIIVLSNISM